MDETGNELLTLLDGLPLALAQAAVYLHETRLDIASYVELYKQQWDELIGPGSGTSASLVDYDRSLGTTWTITFRLIEEESMSAANLLRLWAFFSNKDLWHGLLQAAADSRERWPRWLYNLACNEVFFLGATRLLLRYSMIEAQESLQGSYMMHPVVHRWLLYMQDDPERGKFLQLAVMLLGESVPDGDESENCWVLQRRLLPHLERCSWWMGELRKAGWTFDDFATLDQIQILADLYMAHCKLKEAEPMYLQALEGYEMTLGPDHPSTLETVHGLGALYREQGRWEEAEAMYRRALAGFAFKRNQLSTFNVLSSLGTLYLDLDRLEESNVMFEFALKGKERALGWDHPSTLSTVHNFGCLYETRGLLDEAEGMYRRMMEGFEKTFGWDHLGTLKAAHNLGNVYADQGRPKEAEMMYQRALLGRERALGIDHKSTLRTAGNLGLLYAELGHFGEAEAIIQLSLKGFEKVLGRDHIWTLQVVSNLGYLRILQGRPEDAEPMYQRALVGYVKTLGRDHISTLRVGNALRSLCEEQGRLQEAEVVHQRALAGSEKTFR